MCGTWLGLDASIGGRQDLKQALSSCRQRLMVRFAVGDKVGEVERKVGGSHATSAARGCHPSVIESFPFAAWICATA